MSQDDAVRATNDDAASCKRFAVHAGYWADPYVHFFVRNPERKAPEINRGYYARTQSIRHLLRNFLNLTKLKCQVINLGAGFDTSYWTLKKEGLEAECFVDVDFETITNRKLYYINRCKPLLNDISKQDGELITTKYDLHSSHYHIIGVDLRDLAMLDRKLQECNIDKNVPTVFITECVLVYMETQRAENLIHWIAENFSTAGFINYEQVNMKDKFGKVMVENLKSRNCTLHGVEACASLESQKQRFVEKGWKDAGVWNMTHVYASLPQADIQRIEKLEFLDDQEMLLQLLEHYCLCWAYKDSLDLGLSSLSYVPA